MSTRVGAIAGIIGRRHQGVRNFAGPRRNENKREREHPLDLSGWTMTG